MCRLCLAVTPVATDFAAPIAVKFDRYGQMHVLENKTGGLLKIVKKPK
jgi:hypothetical protein